MTKASDRVAELRAELAQVEATVKAEGEAKRAADRAARRAKLEAHTDTFREANYAAYSGPHDSYVGVSSYSKGIELSLNEYTSFQSSATLTREEALALAADIQKLLK